MQPVALSPQQRESALDAMATTELDVLVVGGGVVGAGCALDAVTRGLNVGLVEARDFASGTSSRSSKLIHGGLRYLEMLDFALVAEALQERGLLIQRLAPHLVRRCRSSTRFADAVWERVYAGAGVALYDTLAVLSGPVPRPAAAPAPDPPRGAAGRPVAAQGRLVGRAAVLRRPGRRRPAHDVPGAHRRGVRRARRQPRPRGRTSSARASGSSAPGCRTSSRAAGSRCGPGRWSTPPACGPTTPRRWSDERGQFQVRATKGIHLVVPRDRIRSESGLILRTEKSVLFVIPWGRHWIIGTTDTDWELDKAHPAASASDIDYLLEHVNAVLATAAHPRRRRGRLRRAAAAAAGRVRRRPPSCPASTPSRTRSRGSWWSRAASTRPTG